MRLDAARKFVAAQGSLAEQAGLRLLINGHALPQSAIDAVLQGQRADGAWAPFWAPDYGSFDATCYRLAQAHSIGIGSDHVQIQEALGFILQGQREDGHWEEDQRIAEVAPPWAAPGELASTLYLTANCGWWIGLHHAGAKQAQRSGAFLEPYLNDEGKLPSFANSHWLAAGLWLKLGWRDKAELVMSYLSSRRTGRGRPLLANDRIARRGAIAKSSTNREGRSSAGKSPTRRWRLDHRGSFRQ